MSAISTESQTTHSVAKEPKDDASCWLVPDADVEEHLRTKNTTYNGPTSTANGAYLRAHKRLYSNPCVLARHSQGLSSTAKFSVWCQKWGDSNLLCDGQVRACRLRSKSPACSTGKQPV